MGELRVRYAPSELATIETPVGWTLVDRWFDELSDAVGGPWVSWLSGTSLARAPRSDVLDLGDRYEVRTELPGVPKERVEVRVRGDRLTLATKSSASSDASEGSFVVKEREEAASQRSFTMPRAIPAAELTARLENGVLIVTVPKPAEPSEESVPVA